MKWMWILLIKCLHEAFFNLLRLVSWLYPSKSTVEGTSVLHHRPLNLFRLSGGQRGLDPETGLDLLWNQWMDPFEEANELPINFTLHFCNSCTALTFSPAPLWGTRERVGVDVVLTEAPPHRFSPFHLDVWFLEVCVLFLFQRNIQIQSDPNRSAAFCGRAHWQNLPPQQYASECRGCAAHAHNGAQ